MTSTIDLHMHSFYSEDGEFSPAELVQQCNRQNIKIMSIPDHNCVRANKIAQEESFKSGITYIPSIEIDCTYQEINFHMLGYGINYESHDFEWIESNIIKQSKDVSQKMLLKTQTLGFKVTSDDMDSLAKNMYWKDRWTGDMFAEVLLNKQEYKDNELLQPYRPGGSRSDNPYVNFYWDYYSQGKPCYVKRLYPSLENILDIIHANDGKAILAHPGVNLKGYEILLNEIIALGIDGIEAFSSYHSSNQSSYFCKQAKMHRIMVTCGSDYHGKTKPTVYLGNHRCLIPDEEIITNLSSLIKK